MVRRNDILIAAINCAIAHELYDVAWRFMCARKSKVAVVSKNASRGIGFSLHPLADDDCRQQCQGIVDIENGPCDQPDPVESSPQVGRSQPGPSTHCSRPAAWPLARRPAVLAG